MQTKATYRLTIALLFAMLIGVRCANAQNYALTATQVDSLVSILPTLPNDSTKAWILVRICSNHPNVDSTLKYAQILHTLSLKIGEQWTSRAYRYMGWYCQMTDNPNEALKYYFKSLKITDSLNLKVESAFCHNSLGENFEAIGDFNSANKHFHDAMNLLSEDNNPMVTYSIRNIGIVYMAFHIYDASEKYFNDALKIDADNNMEIQVMIDHHYIALNNLEMYESKGDTAQLMLAKRHSDIASKMANEKKLDFYILNTDICAIQTYIDIAELQTGIQKQHTIDSCEMLCEKATRLAKDNGFYELMKMNLQLSDFQIQLAKGNYAKCEKLLKEVMEYAYGNPLYKRELPEVYACYKSYSLAIGDYKNALVYTDLFNKTKKQSYDRTFNENSIKSNAEAEFKIEMQKHQLEEKKKEILFKEKQKRKYILMGAILLFIALLSGLAIEISKNSRRRHNMNLILYKKKEEFKAQRDELANANYEAMSSIKYAKQIQTAIIPTEKNVNEIFGESLILWNPVEIVSGDFYWVQQIGKYKILAVADCTGHGVPGAFMSMLGITSLNDIISTIDIGKTSASEILDKLRHKINIALHQSEEGGLQLDGLDIAFCIFDIQNMTMQYAGAYIPLILIRAGILFQYQADKMPVGYMNKNVHPFTNNMIDLKEGDLLYFYTDGITNQISNEDRGIKFSPERMNDLLLQVHQKNFAEQKLDVEDALVKWRTSSLGNVCRQTDDELLVGIRI